MAGPTPVTLAGAGGLSPAMGPVLRAASSRLERGARRARRELLVCRALRESGFRHSNGLADFKGVQRLQDPREVHSVRGSEGHPRDVIR